jgi:hypothetical protein
MKSLFATLAILAAAPAAAQQYDEPGTSNTFGNTTLGITDSGKTYEVQRFGGTTLYRDSDGHYTYSYSNGGHTITNSYGGR